MSTLTRYQKLIMDTASIMNDLDSFLDWASDKPDLWVAGVEILQDLELVWDILNEPARIRAEDKLWKRWTLLQLRAEEFFI